MVIKISDKALVALEGLSTISNSMIINDSNLYVKLISDEQKGIMGIVGEYKLVENDISLDKEFGINSIPEFLKIIKSCDKDSLELEQIGNTINIKDNRKVITYYTQSSDSLPVKNPAGDKLYETGKTTIGFALIETEIEKIKQDLSLVRADTLKLVSEKSELYIVAESSITSNKTKIKINKDYVQMAEGEFTFPTVDVFNAILKCNYKIQVKECVHGNNTIGIMKLESMEYVGLTYTLVSAQ